MGDMKYRSDGEDPTEKPCKVSIAAEVVAESQEEAGRKVSEALKAASAE